MRSFFKNSEHLCMSSFKTTKVWVLAFSHEAPACKIILHFQVTCFIGVGEMKVVRYDQMLSTHFYLSKQSHFHRDLGVLHQTSMHACLTVHTHVCKESTYMHECIYTDMSIFTKMETGHVVSSLSFWTQRSMTEAYRMSNANGSCGAR